ncbi:hypothetical protein [Natrinema altunense]|uniref:RiboL-PSP-HEPN domain-containing protein n=1 Tax=Natrinema altunense TaxID=222984 RepID=A0A482XXI2_9EURY|nr:hypothetical protein [Natrinema altunense]RZH67190.1 hypothetical protein ELS17_15700 [Natrinema altunense]
MRMKTHFSHIHFESAVTLFEDAERLEQDYKDDDLDSRFNGIADARTAHDGYVVSSIVSSMCFLDSVVNEFYDELKSSADAWKAGEEPFLNLNSEEEVYNLIVRLQDVERRDFEYRPTLKKYQLLLTYVGKDIYDKGRSLYQSADTVSRVRNNLVHFEPSWHSSEEPLDLPGNLPTDLNRNPFYEVENKNPVSYLSADVARWCISATGKFVIDFYDRMGMGDSAIVYNVNRTIESI